MVVPSLSASGPHGKRSRRVLDPTSERRTSGLLGRPSPPHYRSPAAPPDVARSSPLSLQRPPCYHPSPAAPLAVCRAALLLKVFYFDLSQYHGADAGQHAVVVSERRAAAWSLLHLPLMGTVLWIGAAIRDLVGSRHDALDRPHTHWGLFAACSSYLLICTVQQLLHQGIGTGRRRIGRRGRIGLRSAFVLGSAVCAAVSGACSSRCGAPSAQWPAVVAYAIGLTALAALELYGRGRKRAPKPAAEARAWEAREAAREYRLPPSVMTRAVGAAAATAAAAAAAGSCSSSTTTAAHYHVAPLLLAPASSSHAGPCAAPQSQQDPEDDPAPAGATTSAATTAS